jgi:hypothetical protein
MLERGLQFTERRSHIAQRRLIRPFDLSSEFVSRKQMN